jgi:phage anti-repressor protein
MNLRSTNRRGRNNKISCHGLKRRTGKVIPVILLEDLVRIAEYPSKPYTWFEKIMEEYELVPGRDIILTHNRKRRGFIGRARILIDLAAAVVVINDLNPGFNEDAERKLKKRRTKASYAEDDSQAKDFYKILYGEIRQENPEGPPLADQAAEVMAVRATIPECGEAEVLA